MSLKSWRAEFYPEVAGSVPKERALQHSLRKWEGLRRENLEKHGGRLGGGNGVVFGNWTLQVNAATCSLCVHHLAAAASVPACESCPLFKVRGRSCDTGAGHPYGAFVWDGDPEPMIALIKQAMGGKSK